MEDDFESASYLSELIDSYNYLCGDPYAARKYAESKGGEPPEKIEDRIAMLEEAITLKEEELNLPLTYPEYASNKNNESPSSEEAKNNTSQPPTEPQTELSTEPKVETNPVAVKALSRLIDEYNDLCNDPYATANYMDELGVSDETPTSEKISLLKTAISDKKYEIENAVPLPKGTNVYSGDFNNNKIYYDEDSVYNACDGIRRQKKVLDDYVGDIKKISQNFENIPEPYNIVAKDLKFDFDNVSDTLQENYTNVMEKILTISNAVMDYSKGTKTESSSKVLSGLITVPTDDVEVQSADIPNPFEMANGDPLSLLSADISTFTTPATNPTTAPQPTTPATDILNPFEMANGDPLSLLSADISTFTTPATIPVTPQATTTPQPTTPATDILNPFERANDDPLFLLSADISAFTTPATNPTTAPQPTTPATDILNPFERANDDPLSLLSADISTFTTPATIPVTPQVATTPQPTTLATDILNPFERANDDPLSLLSADISTFTTPATIPVTPQATTPATNPTTTPQPTPPATNPTTTPQPTTPATTTPQPTTPSTENSYSSNNVSSSQNEKFTFTNEITNNDTTQKVEKVDSDIIKNNEYTSYSNDKVFTPTFTTIPPVNNNTESNIPVIGASAVALALAGTVGGKFYIDKEQKKDKEKTTDQEKSKESQNDNENLSTKSE